MNTEKLTISFWIWGLFDTCENGIYHDCEARIRELKERGFNCIRLEDGAGLYCKPDGTKRGQVLLSPPFGKYSRLVRQSDILHGASLFDIRARLLEMFRAADRQDVSIILSSWYFLHTNWFFSDEVNHAIFSLSTEQKMRYFADELDYILTLLRENGLIHRVAFAELFNEFDGLPFAGEYRNDLDPVSAMALRAIHESCLARLKARHPDVLFAVDVADVRMQEELYPRNADVLNFHCYYMWPIYYAFDHGLVQDTLTEPEIPEIVAQYLLPEGERVSVADVKAAVPGGLRTGIGWGRRVSLYNSMNPAAFPALEAVLSEELSAQQEQYWAVLEESVQKAKELQRRILPKARLVMGEGGGVPIAQSFPHVSQNSRLQAT